MCVVAFVLFFGFFIIVQRFTCCSDKEVKQSRKQIITEHAILSDRIYYEDEAPPRPQIKPHKIFEDYDPDVTGRIASYSTERNIRHSTGSNFSFTDSDWEERTDDEALVYAL